jgi:glycosyltransferase involved in cell wall biosynthesis
MGAFSVVVVCKNEAGIIEQLLRNVVELTDDVVIYDNGSTDGTLDIIKQYPVRLHQGPWMGYGKTKQQAVGLARHDWVLSIDADEIPDKTLQQHLHGVALDDPNVVYRILFKNFLGNKHLKWGEWGGDRHIRLFNRQRVNWNDAGVHEQLILPEGIKVRVLEGSILHKTMKDTAEYSQKMVHYALLNAEKYAKQGKKATWIKRYISPRFTFIKYYILRLGFLDGWEGLVSARMTAFYTALKYARLYELRRQTANGKRQ